MDEAARRKTAHRPDAFQNVLPVSGAEFDGMPD